jgi:hypothetical protein
VRRRALPYRLLSRAGKLLVAAIGRWRITAGDEPPPTKPLLAAQQRPAVFHLPEQLDPGRVWMQPGRHPFIATVWLPGERRYHAGAWVAVADGPNRLTVQLKPMGLDDTESFLAGYATEWGFPKTAIADWRAGAERRPATDRDHSTHVFTAEPVGDVHIEFEVSHHVREGVFTIAAHFTRQM